MRIGLSFIAALLFASAALGQKAEVTIRLNEAFFDAALDALFVNNTPLEFPIAEIPGAGSRDPGTQAFGFAQNPQQPYPRCSETIRIQREVNGSRTTVRFRDGRIYAPLAFSGNYNPPFVGCVGFSGWAESLIDLEFDGEARRLVARVRVLNVNLSGTGGLGGTVVAKLVQSSIDKKINPIELFQLDKLTFAIPMKGTTDVRMRATGIRHELSNGSIEVIVAYEFSR